MPNRSLSWALGAVVLATAGCSVPYTTPEQTITVPYDKFVPNLANGVTLPLVPAFADQSAPPVSFPVPAEAKKVKLEAVTLHLKLKNAGPLPIRLAVYLAKHPDDPYSTGQLGGAEGTIELARDGGTSEKAFPLDPALLTGDQLRLGYKFGSAGTQQPVTFKDTDKIDVTYKVAVTAKLF